MSSSAPKRRLDVRKTPRTATGKRAAVRPRRRHTLRPSPAMLGAFVLVVAGIGAGAASSKTDTDSLSTDYQTISSNYTGGESNDVDITKDIDPQVLKDQTETQAEQALQAQADLTRRAQAAADDLKSDQWVVPVTGYQITGTFGDAGAMWSSTHTGLDFAGPSGSTIVAPTSGTVTMAGWGGAYGNKTEITLEDGTELWFAHQSRIEVSEGDKVTPGQTIGFTGSTGNSTGPHLHLEARPGGGDPIDPLTLLSEHGVDP